MAGISTSIVIVNFNAGTALLALLKSLHLNQATNTEVIVVDNASFDQSLQAAREAEPLAKFFPLETNRGFYYAANKGIDQAEGDVIVVCHADVVTDVHMLSELADQAREYESSKVAAVVPRIVGIDDSEQPFVGTLPGFGSAVSGAFSPTAALKCRVPFLDHLAPEEWARFICVAFNRNQLTTTGLFDKEFFLYCGDTDLCARIHNKQLRILISKTVKVAHAGPSIGKDVPAHFQRIMKKDFQRYTKKYLPEWQQGIVGAVQTVAGLFSKKDG